MSSSGPVLRTELGGHRLKSFFASYGLGERYDCHWEPRAPGQLWSRQRAWGVWRLGCLTLSSACYSCASCGSVLLPYCFLLILLPGLCAHSGFTVVCTERVCVVMCAQGCTDLPVCTHVNLCTQAGMYTYLPACTPLHCTCVYSHAGTSAYTYRCVLVYIYPETQPCSLSLHSSHGTLISDCG